MEKMWDTAIPADLKRLLVSGTYMPAGHERVKECNSTLLPFHSTAPYKEPHTLLKTNLEDKHAVVTLCHVTDKCLLKNLPPLVKNVIFHN
jgi:hypothetical protein